MERERGNMEKNQQLNPFKKAIIAQIKILPAKEVLALIETPPDPLLGDYAFPCFSLAKVLKKNPVEIAIDISSKIKPSIYFEKIEAKGAYINFFINTQKLSEITLKKIIREKEKYGSLPPRKDVVIIEMSSPNIAKPFGIGHLRSTIIGNAISNLAKSQGFKVIKINYLGDWGTQFGKLILGYKKFGDKTKLNKAPIQHLLEIYVQVNADPSLEQEARDWFKKLESGDKEAIQLWTLFKTLSLNEFEKIYALLGITFDVISSESQYNQEMQLAMKEMEKKKLTEESDGAIIINLENLGVCLIQKSDGTTLYMTRDIAAATDRYKKYHFHKMIYEVGAEQKLHFQQLFSILELMGYSWSKQCVHVDHGLYLGTDGKKLATRKGKTIFMEEIFSETVSLAKEELIKRKKLPLKELEKRALSIARAAIFFGDLKNYRSNDAIFDIQRFISFEGDTGPYALYTYARAKSILAKKHVEGKNKYAINEMEKKIMLHLFSYPEIIQQAYMQNAPNIIAQYILNLSHFFNEYYHAHPVLGSEEQEFRLQIVEATSQVLKNGLTILGVPVIEKM